MHAIRTTVAAAAALTCVGASAQVQARGSTLELLQTIPIGSDLCGGTVQDSIGRLVITPCFGNALLRYTTAGVPLMSFPSAFVDNIDVDIASIEFSLNNVLIQAGTILMFRGDGFLTICAIEPEFGPAIWQLDVGLATDSIVGGALHPIRGTFFVVQQSGPPAAPGNIVSEIDADTGVVISDFSLVPLGFNVDYGDLEINPVSGNLFLVSSSESSIAEFTPDGVLVAMHNLPPAVSGLSGIGIDTDQDRAWVFSQTTGSAYLLSGLNHVPCPADTNNDGLVTPADFNAWVFAFNAMGLACDQNGDGQCTPSDFSAFIANFNAGC